MAGSPASAAASASLLGLAAVAALGHVGVGAAAPEVAVDPALDAVGDPRQRGLVRGAVGARCFGPELRPQLRVDHPVLGGDLGGRVAGDAAREPVGLQEHDPHAGLLEHRRERDADDAAAQDRDVGLDEAVQLGELRLAGRGVDPQRGSSAARLAQRELLQAHQRLGVAAERAELERREEGERPEHSVGVLGDADDGPTVLRASSPSSRTRCRAGGPWRGSSAGGVAPPRG